MLIQQPYKEEKYYSNTNVAVHYLFSHSVCIHLGLGMGLAGLAKASWNLADRIWLNMGPNRFTRTRFLLKNSDFRWFWDIRLVDI